MSKWQRAVPVLIPLFLLLGCADDHRVAGPVDSMLPEMLASTSGTEYEVVRLTYPFNHPLFGIEYHKADVASWVNNGNGMNDNGWITGRVGSNAATWDSRGVLRVLPIPVGSELCHGAGINNAGDAVGSCWDVEWTWGSVPVFWDGAYGTAHPLSMKVGEVTYFRGSARAINDERIAGFLHTEDQQLVAVVWSSPGADPVRLPELDPLPDGLIGSYAVGINRRGDIVGQSNHQAAAWLLDDDNGYNAVPLPHGVGSPSSVLATSINNNRDILAGYGTNEPYKAWQAPWHPWTSYLTNIKAHVRLWLYKGGESWLTVLSEDVDYPGLNDIADRTNGFVHLVGEDKGGARPILWSFDAATGKMLDETRLPNPDGWHRNNTWCWVRAIDPQRRMAGLCREVKGNDFGIWEIIVWRPLGEPSNPPPPPPPSDGLGASFEYNCGNTAICQFRCTSTGAVDNRGWTFVNGDPGTSTETAPEVRFNKGGDHRVALTVWDADGGAATAEATVKCSSHPLQGVRCR
jgi:hypothetical protein